jgi:hypothetical protein
MVALVVVALEMAAPAAQVLQVKALEVVTLDTAHGKAHQEAVAQEPLAVSDTVMVHLMEKLLAAAVVV